ncbi:hypothetical protein HHI36_017728 [Cryptolaemus montrouzieri]|uniref:Uncharacterized protein n=1 Tax=Cryptolaemus montrouzieri TaxID=559131 RepID=A0ABD2NP23_9CUCU
MKTSKETINQKYSQPQGSFFISKHCRSRLPKLATFATPECFTAKLYMEAFRELNDTNGKPLTRNFRAINPLSDRHVFHVNPSNNKHTTLYPLALSNKRQRI